MKAGHVAFIACGSFQEGEKMKKGERRLILTFVTPLVVVFLLMYLYPAIKTFSMTFFHIRSLTVAENTWEFVGMKNYLDVLNSPLFHMAIKNMLKIIFIGGVFHIVISFLFAIVLKKGMRLGGLWKCIIYLPCVVSPVAMVIVWTQYVYNNRFGLLKSVFDFLGMEAMASFEWTSPVHSFAALLIAYTFGGIGASMIMMIAAMDKIPMDLYHSAELDGASDLQMFFRITLPLMKDVTKTVVTFWCIGGVNFFLWAQIFSNSPNDPSTVVSATYMYNLIFGSGVQGGQIESSLNVGAGTVVGVLMCVMTVIVFAVINVAFGKETYEY